jgi:hypothetical protein
MDIISNETIVQQLLATDSWQTQFDLFLPIGCYSIVFDVRRKLTQTRTRISAVIQLCLMLEES